MNPNQVAHPTNPWQRDGCRTLTAYVHETAGAPDHSAGTRILAPLDHELSLTEKVVLLVHDRKATAGVEAPAMKNANRSRARGSDCAGTDLAAYVERAATTRSRRTVERSKVSDDTHHERLLCLRSSNRSKKYDPDARNDSGGHKSPPS